MRNRRPIRVQLVCSHILGHNMIVVTILSVSSMNKQIVLVSNAANQIEKMLSKLFVRVGVDYWIYCWIRIGHCVSYEFDDE